MKSSLHNLVFFMAILLLLNTTFSGVYAQQNKQPTKVNTQIEADTKTDSLTSCNNATPGWGENLGKVSFKTSHVWKVGNQEWSDVVMATGCDKVIYNGGKTGNYNADCRRNRAGFGDLFSWCAVFRFQEQLCPDSWRVPTVDDFVNLDVALGGNGENRSGDIYALKKYTRDLWGGVHGGCCKATGEQVAEDWDGDYWSQTAYDSSYGLFLLFNTAGAIHPKHADSKYHGMALRCVR